jgi:hypothetical protein
MKVAVQLLALALVLAGCQPHEPKGDANRGLVGTWVFQFIAPDGAYTEITKVIGVGGHCISYVTATLSNQVSKMEAQSRVEVKDGYYVETGTNGSQVLTNRFPIVRLDDRELVLRNGDQEDVFRRQR